MTAVNYETEKLIGGEIKTNQVPLAADTYYRGMPLKYSSGVYVYTAVAADIQAIFLEDGRVVAGGDYGTVIVGGEIQAQGLVDDSNAPFTVTEAVIASLALNGLYVKKK